MSRRNRYYYCPKCNAKKLRNMTWRESGRSFWECCNAKCKLRIEVEGRDSEIADYLNPVDRLARYELRIPDYFVQNERNVYRKGFEVIYEGEVSFLVRHRTKDEGICVGFYWKATTIDMDDDGDDGDDVVNPCNERYLFDHDAAKAIKFRGESLLGIISRGRWPTIVWRKGQPSRYNGTLNAALKAQIVEWATDLDTAIPGLIDKARGLIAEWTAESDSIGEYIDGSGITLISFNRHQTESVVVKVRPITIEEGRRIEGVIGCKLKVQLINDASKGGVNYVTLDQADAVVKLLDLKDFRFRIHLKAKTPELVKKLADTLRAAVAPDDALDRKAH